MSRRHAVARVDLGAIRSNVAALAGGTSAEVMAVVKADGYGHGLVPSAQAAVEGGATWLGTALLDEALALRAAGLTGPRVLAWLMGPGEAWAEALQADVDVSVNAEWALAEVVAAARETGVTARVHLKVDTGLSRGGAAVADWPSLVVAARNAEAEGAVHVVGLWSHFAYADAPGHPTIARQADVFREAVAHAEGAGIDPEVRHLANSAATLTAPDQHFDLVRPGIALYGGVAVADMPNPMQPVVTLQAPVLQVREVRRDDTVGYGAAEAARRTSRVAIVGVGYADGYHRRAGSSATRAGARAYLRDRFVPLIGRISMDLLALDVTDVPNVSRGDVVELLGPHILVDEVAGHAGTIGYEILTSIGRRYDRAYVRTHG